MTTIADLILEATERGYDVMISVRRREDGGQGTVRMPNEWARRLGMSDDQIDELRARQSGTPGGGGVGT